MRRIALSLLLVLALVPALAAPAEARSCRSVGAYSITASGISCPFARDAVRGWRETGRTPRGWRCVKRRHSLSCSRSRQAFGAYRRQP